MEMEIYFLLLIANCNCTLRTSALHASQGKASEVGCPLKARKEISTWKSKRRCLFNGSRVEASQRIIFCENLHISYISEAMNRGRAYVWVRDETFQEKWDEKRNPEFPVPLPGKVVLTQRFCFIILRGLLRGPLLCFFKMKKNQRKLNLIKKIMFNLIVCVLGDLLARNSLQQVLFVIIMSDVPASQLDVWWKLANMDNAINDTSQLYISNLVQV